MNTAPTDPITDELAEGGTWLLDLVAAVDYLRRGIRPGITVWDALGESLRWLLADIDPDARHARRLAAAIVDAMAADVEARSRSRPRSAAGSSRWPTATTTATTGPTRPASRFPTSSHTSKPSRTRKRHAST